MTNLYITTSRKPSQSTRKLARWFALLTGAVSENRGKSSVGECVERARVLGMTRLLFVYEKQGNPVELAFYDASAQSESENEGGAWLEPSIAILGVSFPEEKQKLGRAFKHVRVKPLDAEGEEVKKLFAFEQEEFEEVGARELVEIIAGGGRLSFKIAGKQVGPALKIKLETTAKKTG
ncbi:hypothetical protein H0N96_02040 [Candidatus Micrarchaeota archaeon]|nr:hypothetical protein [Candidatus Micrarchaeota archaeon]